MRADLLFLATTWLSLSNAQGLSADDLASLPDPIIQAVPVGAVEQTVQYDADDAFDDAYNSFSSSSTRRRHIKRGGECSVQPVGSGPVTSPDTDTDFLNNPAYSQAATDAVTPIGWSLIFKNQQAAISTSAYMGYKTYTTYDPSACAADCLNMAACQSFNLFYERDPALAPASGCPNPGSTVPIKCSFWGTAIPTKALTNKGQWRNKFHVVIAGSNGYSVTNPTYDVPGFDGTSTGRATVNSPNQCDSYITFKSHTGPYDPNLCAADCLAEQTNPAQFGGKVCRFFASYQLVKNGQIQAQICALYTRAWDASYAVNTGYHSKSDTYTIVNAYSYSLTSDPGTKECNNGVLTSSFTTLSTVC